MTYNFTEEYDIIVIGAGHPTNDLDVETLELLEEILTDYQGTLLIVSHDRQFIDNVATECYFFEGAAY